MSKPREFWALPEKSMGEAKIHGVESVMILCIEKSAYDKLKTDLHFMEVGRDSNLKEIAELKATADKLAEALEMAEDLDCTCRVDDLQPSQWVCIPCDMKQALQKIKSK